MSAPGWETYWRYNGVHRNHAAPVAGCTYCAEDAAPAAAPLVAPSQAPAAPEPASEVAA